MKNNFNNCPFCNPRIIEKQKIFETDSEYVFYNIRKGNKGRCLVVPKRHVENIRNLSKKEIDGLFKTVQNVSKIISDYLKPDGINYGFNEGKRAGQMVSHFHVHILPRFGADLMPEYHLFHEDPRNDIDLSSEELDKLVSEFKKIF